jgi:hypothetical protein
VLSIEEFDSLQVSDVIEADPLLPGLSEEPVSLRVSKINDDKTEIQFVPMWYGITLGRWFATKGDNGIEWRLT